jgi:DNA end-binding protein Ku
VLLAEGMKRLKRCAIAQVVLRGKEQLVMVRPLDGLLVMTMLEYSGQVAKPATFQKDVPDEKSSPAERELVETLINSQTAKEFDFGQFKDAYTEKLHQLIEAKIAGNEIVTPPEPEHAQVINLMDALKKSVAQAQGEGQLAQAQEQGEPEKAAKPPKKMAKSVSGRTAKKKRKLS